MKYLIVDSNNLILGWSDNPKSEHQVSTSNNIPDYDITTQSIYWENDQIAVKDDDQKIAEKHVRIATQYQRDRKREYPSIEECIHAILDDSLEALQAKRNAVKTKYPEPK